MKKLVISGILATAFVFSSAFAISWGGMVDNSSKLSVNNDFSVMALDQSNGIYLSVNSNITEGGSLRFTGEGLYKYETDTPVTNFQFTDENNTVQND